MAKQGNEPTTSTAGAAQEQTPQPRALDVSTHEEQQDFVSLISGGIGQVMRDRTQMPHVKKTLFTWYTALPAEGKAEAVRAARAQVETGKLALESLFSEFAAFV